MADGNGQWNGERLGDVVFVPGEYHRRPAGSGREHLHTLLGALVGAKECELRSGESRNHRGLQSLLDNDYWDRLATRAEEAPTPSKVTVQVVGQRNVRSSVETPDALVISLGCAGLEDVARASLARAGRVLADALSLRFTQQAPQEQAPSQPAA